MSIDHVHYPEDEKLQIANIKISLVQAFAARLFTDQKQYIEVKFIYYREKKTKNKQKKNE